MTQIDGEKLTKKTSLRNNEYYVTQEMFDKLYKESKANKKFKDLMPLIVSEENIKLAYRNIRKNKGSKTSGVNHRDIRDISKMSIEEVVEYVRKRLVNYKPHAVRRKEIPKENGGVRPLGIPTIEDRLIQQCIKQVLEPICEAKFYTHSYGFRPNRSTHHAIARAMTLMNQSKLHYVVDVDIKGFFDNVDHSKLIKQLWNLGIQDKNLICVIEDSKSVFSFEKVGNYRGVYHVLNGLISPADNIGPDNINLSSLVKRVNEASKPELILALKSTIEGETTTLYIKKIFRKSRCTN